ncbi:ATPase [Salinicola avicenniae]|uniref:ATPase n=1 Tax=Salinicola avicenniae TaxID=2916836 RepID=UPI0020745148|nr:MULTISPECIES: ATPase [unclassified Salinicola]
MSAFNESNSQGIQALIDSLREQGVEAGRQQATQMVEEAQQRADWLLRQAEEEAAAVRATAEADAETLRRSGHQALQLAYRDLCLTARDTFAKQFARELQTLVRQTLDSPDLLARLILEAAGREPVPETLEGVALLPETVIGLEALRTDASALHEGPLPGLLAEVAERMLERGIVLSGDARHDAGVRFVLENGQVEVDLTDGAIAALLLRHLQPRFRALLEGVVS